MTEKYEFLVIRLGDQFVELIQSFIRNFPQNTKLCISPDMEKKEFQECQIICFIISIVFAYNITQNPISSLFFEPNGTFPENLKNHINSMYFIGNQPEKIEDYLLYFLKNYDSLKNSTFNKDYSKGGSYKCSDTCDFIYVINQCGGPQEKATCPFCSNEIGGINHKKIERKGHENLTDAEAVAFLEERVNFYNLSGKTGFQIDQINPMAGVRLMKSKLSYHFLNLVTCSIFYFFSIKYSKLAVLEEYFSLDSESLVKKLHENITEDFFEIYKMIESNDPYIWILSSVSQLVSLLEQTPEMPLSIENRNNFEVLVEQRILLGHIETINSYKQLVNSYAKFSDFFNFIEEINLPPKDQYYHSQFFRITQEPSFKHMIPSFNLSSRKPELKILDNFIQNSDKIENLECFYPIVDFTNYLLEKFNFSISRFEASKNPISMYYENDIKMKDLFNKFKNSWKKLSIKLIDGCKSFDKINFSKHTSLSHYLIENDINSDGIYITSALKSLANLQNSILKLLISEENSLEYPIQSLQPIDILKFSNNNDNLASQCSVNNLKYSMGKEVIYDFDRFQLNLSNDL